jgi:hypothetical protein
VVKYGVWNLAMITPRSASGPFMGNIISHILK